MLAKREPLGAHGDTGCDVHLLECNWIRLDVSMRKRNVNSLFILYLLYVFMGYSISTEWRVILSKYAQKWLRTLANWVIKCFENTKVGSMIGRGKRVWD